MTDTAAVLRYTAFDVDGEGGNPAGVVLDARGMDDARTCPLGTVADQGERNRGADRSLRGHRQRSQGTQLSGRIGLSADPVLGYSLAWKYFPK
jgi:hypothetical protein